MAKPGIKVAKRCFIPFTDAIPLLETGDVALFRGCSLLSWLISGYTDSKYTHVGLVKRDEEERIVELVEFREFKGGRSSNLETAVKDASGRIDIYRPVDPFVTLTPEWDAEGNLQLTTDEIPFEGKRVVRALKILTGQPYGMSRILWLWLRKAVFLRMLMSFVPEKSEDVNAALECPVCSTSVAYVFNRSGYLLLNNKNPNLVEPGEIALSPHLQYLFTLTADTPVTKE